MKVLVLVSALFITTLAHAGWRQDARAVLKEYKYACKTVEVNVESIVRDEWIEGQVKGLPEEAFDKFKMIFYVKTNRWYVHPFEGADEGQTYAYLNEQGEFKIRTVKREITSKQLAAVLVPRAVPVKSQRWWLKPFLGIFGGVLKYSCAHSLVDGNGDFLH